MPGVLERSDTNNIMLTPTLVTFTVDPDRRGESFWKCIQIIRDNDLVPVWMATMSHPGFPVMKPRITIFQLQTMSLPAATS